MPPMWEANGVVRASDGSPSAPATQCALQKGPAMSVNLNSLPPAPARTMPRRSCAGAARRGAGSGGCAPRGGDARANNPGPRRDSAPARVGAWHWHADRVPCARLGRPPSPLPSGSDQDTSPARLLMREIVTSGLPVPEHRPAGAHPSRPVSNPRFAYRRRALTFGAPRRFHA